MSFTALLTAGGIGLQAFGAYRQAQYAEAQAKAQAQIMRNKQIVAEQNAKAAQAKGLFDQLRALRRGKERIGRLRSQLGKANVLMDREAPANMLAEQAVRNAEERAYIGYASKQEQYQQLVSAGAYGASAENLRTQAEYTKEMGRWNVGKTLMGGFLGMGETGMLEKTPFADWWKV
jgi:hypothetical protein